MADEPVIDEQKESPSAAPSTTDLGAEIISLKEQVFRQEQEIQMLQKQNIKLKTTILNAAMNIYGGP